MYRAILEEVARYLDKCHKNMEVWQHQERMKTQRKNCSEEQTIERSKSISHFEKEKFIISDLHLNDDDGEAEKVRTRSSTNLHCSTPHHIRQKSGTFIGAPSSLSYSTFKDFTWFVEFFSPKYPH